MASAPSRHQFRGPPSYKPPSNSLVAGPVNLGASFGRNFKAGNDAGLELLCGAAAEQRLWPSVSPMWAASRITRATCRTITSPATATAPRTRRRVPSLRRRLRRRSHRIPAFSDILEYDSGGRRAITHLQATSSGTVARPAGAVQLYLAEDDRRGQLREHRRQPEWNRQSEGSSLEPRRIQRQHSLHWTTQFCLSQPGVEGAELC